MFDGLPRGETPARWSVEVVDWLPHDPGAFTQGLEVSQGVLYESTGLWGQSSLRTLDPQTGQITARLDLPDDLFGEGLTVVDDRIIQLTWKAGRALTYHRETLTPLQEFAYEGEGWGLCSTGSELWMSNGSNRLQRRDPHTFELIDSVTVTVPLTGPGTEPGAELQLHNLNELECFDGVVIANVWLTEHLLAIDTSQPGGATVIAVIDASPLVRDAEAVAAGEPIDVLNGVADPRDGSGTLWMTGKNWPRLYRVRLVPA